jgi:3-oxoacyl-[acyl-carrier-protein] synthase II
MKRVVITGMGTVNPLGTDINGFWNNIVANKLGFSYIDKFDTTDFDIKIVAAVKNFDPSKYIEKKEARRIDRFSQFDIVSANDALKDSGTDLKDLDHYRVGVIIGCGIGGLEIKQSEHAKYL